VVYFVFIICLCVVAVVATVVVLHLYLRAESSPVKPMPAWVSLSFNFDILSIEGDHPGFDSFITTHCMCRYSVALCISTVLRYFFLWLFLSVNTSLYC